MPSVSCMGETAPGGRSRRAGRRSRTRLGHAPSRRRLRAARGRRSDRHLREVAFERRVVEGVEADADPDLAGPDVPPEDLAHAELRRPLGLVLVPDHPERHHRARVVARSPAHLDAAVQGRVRPTRSPAPLGRRRRVRTDAGRSCCRRDPRRRPSAATRPARRRSIGTPRLLILGDQQPKRAVPDLVPRGGSLARAPVGEVEGSQRSVSSAFPSKVSSNASSYDLLARVANPPCRLPSARKQMHRAGDAFVRLSDRPPPKRLPLGEPSTSGAPYSVHLAP